MGGAGEVMRGLEDLPLTMTQEVYTAVMVPSEAIPMVEAAPQQSPRPIPTLVIWGEDDALIPVEGDSVR